MGSFSEGLAPVCNGFVEDCEEDEGDWSEEWMVIDTKGKVKFKVDNCRKIHSFSEGLAAFREDFDVADEEKKVAKWGFIDRNGEKVIPAQFDLVSRFSEGRAWVKTNGLAAIIDTSGEYITPSIFEADTYFPDYYYYDTDHLLNPPFVNGRSFGKPLAYEIVVTNPRKHLSWHNSIYKGFSEGVIAVSNGKRYGYTDTQGNLRIPYKYRYAYPFSDGFARVYLEQNEPGGCSFIDKEERIITDHLFWRAKDFSEGLAAVCVKATGNTDDSLSWGYLDASGKIAIPLQFDKAGPFIGGKAIVTKGGNSYHINTKGEPITSQGDFHEGLASIITKKPKDPKNYVEKRWSYIKEDGSRAFAAEFYRAEPFSDGLAAVVVTPNNHKVGFIDKTGKMVIPPSFDWAYNFNSGISAVYIGKRWGFIDKTGRIVIPPIYDEIGIDDKERRWEDYLYDDEIAIVKKGEFWGVIGFNGEIVLPFEYGRILWGEKVKE